jgi:hypothetical protein
MSQETLEQAFTVAVPACLSVSNIRGSVTVLPGDEGQISVTAVKHTHTGDAQRTEIELSQAEDGSVKVATHYREGFWLMVFGSKPCKVDYTVRAPKNCSLKLSGVSNSASVEGLEGEFHFSTVSGELTLKDLSGPLKLNTVSGDVIGERVNGALKVETVSGDLRLSESNLPSADISTVSGDLHLHTPLGDGPYHFHSVSGDVLLFVPAETRFSAEISSVSGSIASSLPQVTRARRNGAQTLKVAEGGPKIRMSSVSGDLWLGAPDAEPGSEHPIETHPAVAERHAVLERIASGEITVEQGVSLLQGKG